MSIITKWYFITRQTVLCAVSKAASCTHIEIYRHLQLLKDSNLNTVYKSNFPAEFKEIYVISRYYGIRDH